MGMAETDFLGHFLFLLLLPRSSAARALDSVQSTPPPALLQIPGLCPGPLLCLIAPWTRNLEIRQQLLLYFNSLLICRSFLLDHWFSEFKIQILGSYPRYSELVWNRVWESPLLNKQKYSSRV